MQYVLLERTHELEDEPIYVYSELDERRCETRRVEFYRGGLCFAYGEERGGCDALSPEPFPEDLRALNRPGEIQARAIPRPLFQEVWNQSAERPDGFMGMFF